MVKTKEEVSQEFKSDVYEHYQNSVSLYMLLKKEADKVKREIKINAEEHDPKRMSRDLHDANMVQMFSSRLIANLADITRKSFETKKELGTTVKTLKP
jgi:signal transduction histidine kinase